MRSSFSSVLLIAVLASLVLAGEGKALSGEKAAEIKKVESPVLENGDVKNQEAEVVESKIPRLEEKTSIEAVPEKILQFAEEIERELTVSPDYSNLPRRFVESLNHTKSTIPLDVLDSHDCASEALQYGHSEKSGSLAHEFLCELQKMFHYFVIMKDNFESQLPLLAELHSKDARPITSFKEIPFEKIVDIIMGNTELFEPQNVELLSTLLSNNIPMQGMSVTMHNIQRSAYDFIHHIQSLFANALYYSGTPALEHSATWQHVREETLKLEQIFRELFHAHFTMDGEDAQHLNPSMLEAFFKRIDETATSIYDYLVLARDLMKTAHSVHSAFHATGLDKVVGSGAKNIFNSVGPTTLSSIAKAFPAFNAAGGHPQAAENPLNSIADLITSGSDVWEATEPVQNIAEMGRLNPSGSSSTFNLLIVPDRVDLHSPESMLVQDDPQVMDIVPESSNAVSVTTPVRRPEPVHSVTVVTPARDPAVQTPVYQTFARTQDTRRPSARIQSNGGDGTKAVENIVYMPHPLYPGHAFAQLDSSNYSSKTTSSVSTERIIEDIILDRIGTVSPPPILQNFAAIKEPTALDDPAQNYTNNVTVSAAPFSVHSSPAASVENVLLSVPDKENEIQTKPGKSQSRPLGSASSPTRGNVDLGSRFYSQSEISSPPSGSDSQSYSYSYNPGAASYSNTAASASPTGTNSQSSSGGYTPGSSSSSKTGTASSGRGTSSQSNSSGYTPNSASSSGSNTGSSAKGTNAGGSSTSHTQKSVSSSGSSTRQQGRPSPGHQTSLNIFPGQVLLSSPNLHTPITAEEEEESPSVVSGTDPSAPDAGVIQTAVELPREKIGSALGRRLNPNDRISISLGNGRLLFGRVRDSKSPIVFRFSRPRSWSSRRLGRVWTIGANDLVDEECQRKLRPLLYAERH